MGGSRHNEDKSRRLKTEVRMKTEERRKTEDIRKKKTDKTKIKVED